MKQILLIAIALLTFTPSSLAEETLEFEAYWKSRDRDGYKWAQVINFTGETVNGTDTALIFTCLDDDPHVMVQHGDVDDDDTTWKERGTVEDVTLHYAINGTNVREIRGFIDGLDSSDVFLYPEDEPAFIAEILAADFLTVNIGPATFDRPAEPVLITFLMQGADEEIGDTLAECGINS